MKSPADYLTRSSDLLLVPTEKQYRGSLNAKATEFVDINPMDFLKLTTIRPGPEAFTTVEDIFREAQPLANYVAYRETYTTLPYLNIFGEPMYGSRRGRVMSHEGRHRAAAIHKAGGHWYRIAIHLFPYDRQWKPEDVPRRWYNEYHRDMFLDTRKLIDEGRLRVVDDNVQREYQR